MKLRHAILLMIACLPLATIGSGQDGNRPLPTDSPSKSVDPPVTKADGKGGDSSTGVTIANPPDRAPGRVVATVVLVKADWSDVEDAGKIEEELKALLQGSSLDESYRNNLLASGPQILFSDQFVSLYDREKFAALIGWLVKFDLFRSAVVRVDSDTGDEKQLEQWNNYQEDSNRWSPIQRSAIFVSEASFPFPVMHRDAPPPFVSYTYGWSWTFTSRIELVKDREDSNVEMDVVREGQRLDELKTQDATRNERRGITGDTRFRFDFPADRVAVLNGLHGFSNSVQGKLRAAEWLPIVYIVPEHVPLDLDGIPALATPASLSKVTTYSRSRFEPPRGYSQGAPSPTRLGKPRPTEDANVIKVFMLKYVKATAAADMLAELVPQVRFVADERMNSIVALGDEKKLEMAEALLLKLDATPAGIRQRSTEKNEPRSEKEQRAKTEEFLRTLRGKFASTEEQMRSLAGAIVKEKDTNATNKLREQLTIVVAEAFGLRQELQKAELALLHERILRVESQVNQRESLRGEIIKRRVDQLVTGAISSAGALGQRESPASNSVRPTKVQMRFEQAPWGQVLEWFARMNGVALQLNEEPAGTFSYQSTRQHTLEEAGEAIRAALPSAFELLQNEGQLILRHRTVPLSPGALSAKGVTTMRGPEAYRRAMVDLNTQIAELESMNSNLKKRQPGIQQTEYDDMIAKFRKQSAMLTAEYAAQVRLFELEAEGDEVALETARQDVERIRVLFDIGRVSSTVMGQATLASQQARIRLEQTKTLLDLYRKAGEGLESRPAVVPMPVKESSNADATLGKSGKGVTIEALPDDGVLIIRGEKNAVERVTDTLKKLDVRSKSAEKPKEEPEAEPSDALPD